MSREKGNFAEKRAISFLKDLDFEIIEQNFYAKKLGEIDIIAKKGEIYHFCEVKSAKINTAFCIDAIVVCEDSIEMIENITI
mgnify:CR=1 FL=1